jgi:pimeloyl-ACP methyl ester carboxylesterase
LLFKNPDLEEFDAVLKGEEELQKFCEAARPEMLTSDPLAITEELASVLPEVDKEAMLGNPLMGQFVAASMAEALRVSADGWIDDDLEMVHPWGFELSEVKVPVLLYQGSEDKMVPYAHGVWLAEHLPQGMVKKHLLQGEGHISIFLGQRDSMIDELLAMKES